MGKRQRPSRVTSSRGDGTDEIAIVPTSPKRNARSQRTSLKSAMTMKNNYGMNGYIKGNLVRIEMKNFLTFSNTVVTPGPRLNLIIGPNGTGKSSIVNAVCIVFGGKLSLLGRGGDLGSFVRHGAREASVEVWVFDPEMPDDVNNVKKVRRVFDSDGRGAFYIDDKKCPLSAVTEINRRYDIQLDNLSQFMPQEKIAEFVNLRPQELLNITVRSLGGTNQVEKLQNLSKTDKLLQNVVKKMKVNEARLQDLRDRNDAAQAEVEAFKQQKEIKKRVRLAQQVLPRRQAEEMRADLIQLVSEKKILNEKVEELKGCIQAAARGTLRELDLKRKAAKQDVSSSKEAVITFEQEAAEPLDEVENITIELATKKGSLRDLDKAAERHENLIRDAQRKVDECQRRLDNIAAQTNEAEDHQKLTECRQQRNALLAQQRSEDNVRGSVDQTRVNAERAVRQLNQSIDNLGDIRHQRIQHLDRQARFRGTAAAVQVVRAVTQEGGFRGRVYGPVVAEISCKDPYHARIMEGCVAGFLLGAFVTENIHDSRTLIAECKKRLQGWSPDTITAPTLPNGDRDEHALLSQRPDRGVDDRLRELGIVAMVSDIFQAPDPVRAALNAQAGLHNIHVGDQRAERNAEALRYENGIRTWYTPSARCAIIRSRYDESVRSLRMETRFSQVTGRLYAGSMDEVERERSRLVQAIRDEEQNMQSARAQLADIAERIDQIRANIQKVDGTARQIESRQRQRSELALMLQRAEQHYKNLSARRSAVTIQNKKQDMLSEIRILEKNAVRLAPKLVNSIGCLKDAMKEMDNASAKRVIAEREYEAEKEKNSSMHNMLEEANERYNQKKEEVKHSKSEYKSKLKEADNAISDSELKAHEEIIAPWLERNSAWLQNEIERLTGRMQGLTTTGPNVLVEYEERQRKIAQLETLIAGDAAGHEERRLEYEEEKKEFMDWLKQGVNHMRSKFSELYQRLGCSGDLEVSNSKSDSLDDLELQILVSYREGAALRPISASSNSGGEKMCCTMLFCFSLLHDEARMPPFVMVDELNQGLDPVNEMKIMTIMFEDAERGAAPQSFVVTPKLLPDLPFQDATKTHVIFNGSIFKGDLSTPFP